MTERVELVQNAAGRMVPEMVNGKPAIPYLGVGKYRPRGRKKLKVAIVGKGVSFDTGAIDGRSDGGA